MHRLISLLVLFPLVSAPVWSADEAHNVAYAKRVFVEKMGQGRFDETMEIYAPGFAAHGANDSYTLAQDNESGREWRRAFPDLAVTVERTVAEGEMVAVHWRAKGTNTAAAGGMPGKGAKVDVQGMTFFRFSDGKIAEEWSLIDIASLMTQIGR